MDVIPSFQLNATRQFGENVIDILIVNLLMRNKY